MPIAGQPNARWSLDFVSDSFGTSRKFRILAVIDDCTRECLCHVADTSLSGARGARELSCHCTLINQILRIGSVFGRFCTLNCNISTGRCVSG